MPKIKEDLKKYRIGEVIKKIRKGYSQKKLVDYITDTWDLCDAQAYKYIKEAYDILAEKADAVIERAKVIQVERIEDLLVDALESSDRTTAVKALDMLNKVYNLYTAKADVTINGNGLRFEFGGDEEVTQDEQ